MRIITYLEFTLLSILIQFSMMDFIQEKLQVDEKPDLNGTSPKRQLRDVLNDITYKPHAIYYRMPKTQAIKNFSAVKQFTNTSLTKLIATTDPSTTLFEILYDENTTDTEDAFTTETFYTSTEIENVTEITLFEKPNQTTSKPKVKPKKKMVEDCSCNFLFGVCDINCCCDSDCSDEDLKIFPSCELKQTTSRKTDDVCEYPLPFSGYGNGLFCIVKVNLPERTTAQEKIVVKPRNQLISWKNFDKSRQKYTFTNKNYKHGDPVWLLKNESVYYIDLPSPTINNYCAGRKPMQFLKAEKFTCVVKTDQDLEMFQIIRSSENTSVISATSASANSSVLNCSTIHCTNWTIIVCNGLACRNYNKDSHEPTCTDNICTNLAYKIDYVFYYKNLKIINATIKFHVRNVMMNLLFITQEITVKFIMANESIDNIVELSGAPGYLEGLPVIVSYVENNHTDVFFNNSDRSSKYFLLPENRNGICVTSNISSKLLLFGSNTRFKCRYHHKVETRNSTQECKNIQNNISNMLRLHGNIFISPFGNPERLKDEDWVSLKKTTLSEEPLYGVIESTSKIHCFNLITRYSFIISYSNAHGNKVLRAVYETTLRNVSFSIDEVSTVFTVDINFIDITRPSVIEYTEGPHLNIHLPTDFFYPFSSNECYTQRSDVSMIILLCYIAIVCK